MEKIDKVEELNTAFQERVKQLNCEFLVTPTLDLSESDRLINQKLFSLLKERIASKLQILESYFIASNELDYDAEVDYLLKGFRNLYNYLIDYLDKYREQFNDIVDDEEGGEL